MLRRGITVETGLYVVMLALAAVTRFWDLGAKALHHDESLHAYYSWLFATGEGYRHHPLMHGPFLFHANALIYLLFGDSDATSRYMPALFGVALVGLPYLLRGPRHLGRWGALVASFLLLISPAILYQSRYIRHDIYTITGTLLFFICIVRYLENPERKWLVIGAASASFLLTNHEIVFAIFAIFGLFLYGAILFGRCREWYRSRPDLVYQLLAIHAGAGFLALVLAKFSPAEYRERILDIPWDSSGISSPPPTRENQLNYYKDLLTNPLVWAFILLIAGFIVATLWTLSRIKADRADASGWIDPLLGDAPSQSVEAGVRHAWQDRAGLALAAGVAVAIFVSLYTSLFTNLNGLISSTVATDGTLLYWLGQHEYRRGEQPWFYFLLLMPQYEFLAITFGTALAGLTVWRGLSAVLRRGSAGPRFFFRLFLTTWFVLIFLGLSYAGEKMPWLVVHISLPATLLAAAVLGGVAERVATSLRQSTAAASHRALRWADGIVLGVILLAGACWVALASRMTNGQFVPDNAANRGGVAANGDRGRCAQLVAARDSSSRHPPGHHHRLSVAWPSANRAGDDDRDHRCALASPNSHRLASQLPRTRRPPRHADLYADVARRHPAHGRDSATFGGDDRRQRSGDLVRQHRSMANVVVSPGLSEEALLWLITRERARRCTDHSCGRGKLRRRGRTAGIYGPGICAAVVVP